MQAVERLPRVGAELTAAPEAAADGERPSRGQKAALQRVPHLLHLILRSGVIRQLLFWFLNVGFHILLMFEEYLYLQRFL